MASSKALTNQKLAAGALVALAAGVLVYLIIRVLTEAPGGEFVAGDHYTLVENPRRPRGDRIEVTEIYSYACIHCYDLEEDLANWVKARSTTVAFARMPAVSSENWRSLARGYYAMDVLGIIDQNHQKVFSAIHDRGLNLASKERFADLVAEQGTSREQFLNAYDSAEVSRRMKAAEELQKRYRVAATPTLVVNGRYLVQPSQHLGLSRMLDVVDYLIARELAERTAKGGQTTGNPQSSSAN